MSGTFKKGRPKKADVDRRDQWLPAIRLTADERATIDAQAARLGLKPHQYARAKLFESPLFLPQFRKLPAEVQKALTDVLKLSGLLLHLSHKVADDELYTERVRQSAFELADIVARSRAFVRERLTDYAGEAKRQQVVNQLRDIMAQLEATSASTDEQIALIGQLYEVVTYLET
ncbi:hypothetical protein [uncultured Fibrella sp.]|uniref:hypothetical protein n=1 Tax=uncultured Fibrella sp. TaxID=1284596 RepID=UPI0035CBFBA6